MSFPRLRSWLVAHSRTRRHVSDLGVSAVCRIIRYPFPTVLFSTLVKYNSILFCFSVIP